jgi:hypothetical protein
VLEEDLIADSGESAGYHQEQDPIAEHVVDEPFHGLTSVAWKIQVE